MNICSTLHKNPIHTDAKGLYLNNRDDATCRCEWMGKSLPGTGTPGANAGEHGEQGQRSPGAADPSRPSRR